MKNQVFTLNPAYTNFKPGITPLQFASLSGMKAPGCGCMGLILVGFMFPMTLLLAWVVVYGVVMDRMYAGFGQEIGVTITDCRMESGKNSKNPRVSYTYHVANRTYPGWQSLIGNQAGDCSLYPAGHTMQALYLEPDPSQSRIIEAVASRGAFDLVAMYIAVAACGVVPLAGFGIAMLREIRSYLRARRIYPRFGAKSMLLQGEIIHIKGDWRSKHTEYYVEVKYVFESPRKRELYGMTEYCRDDLKDKPLPAVGTPVTILYADDNAHVLL